MKLTYRIRQHMAACEKQLNELLKKNPEPPKETLSCYTKNGHVYWRVTDENGNRKHLSVTKKAHAVKMILAQLQYAQIQDLRCEVEACRRYLSYMEKCGGKLEAFITSADSAMQSLIHEAFRPEEKRLQEWADMTYEKSTYRPDQLKISTSRGLLVRSKSEALIAEVLYLLGLPFRYEEVIYINGERFVPDFTVLNPVTMQTFYIEYNGMMDDPGYVERHIRKAETYIRYGLIPDIHMLNFYETNDCKIDLYQIRSRIENFVYGDAA